MSPVMVISIEDSTTTDNNMNFLNDQKFNEDFKKNSTEKEGVSRDVRLLGNCEGANFSPEPNIVPDHLEHRDSLNGQIPIRLTANMTTEEIDVFNSTVQELELLKLTNQTLKEKHEESQNNELQLQEEVQKLNRTVMDLHYKCQTQKNQMSTLTKKASLQKTKFEHQLFRLNTELEETRISWDTEKRSWRKSNDRLMKQIESLSERLTLNLFDCLEAGPNENSNGKEFTHRILPLAVPTLSSLKSPPVKKRTTFPGTVQIHQQIYDSETASAVFLSESKSPPPKQSPILSPSPSYDDIFQPLSETNIPQGLRLTDFRQRPLSCHHHRSFSFISKSKKVCDASSCQPYAISFELTPQVLYRSSSSFSGRFSRKVLLQKLRRWGGTSQSGDVE